MAFSSRRTQRYRLKDWVNRMIIPYTVFFAVSCAVSLFSISTKMHMVFIKLRARTAGKELQMARCATIGGMPISPYLANNTAVKQLKRKLEEHKIEARRNYCHLLVAVFGASSTQEHLDACVSGRFNDVAMWLRVCCSLTALLGRFADGFVRRLLTHAQAARDRTHAMLVMMPALSKLI